MKRTRDDFENNEPSDPSNKPSKSSELGAPPHKKPHKPRSVLQEEAPAADPTQEQDTILLTEAEKAKLVALKKQWDDQVIEIALRNKLTTQPKGTQLDIEALAEFQKKYKRTRANRFLRNSMSRLPVYYLAQQRNYIQSLNFTYSHTLPRYPHASDQGQSGRCWMFAGLNAIRLKLIEALNLPNSFEFSEAFLFFYDKLERFNFSTERAIELSSLPDTNIKVERLMRHGISDGGYWNYFVNLICKYGIVPKTVYGESYNSYSSRWMNQVISTKFRQAIAEIRQRAAAGVSDTELREYKDKEVMPQIYQLLVNFMGEPPNSFSWEFYTRGTGSHASRHQQHLMEKVTPVQFFHELVNPIYKIENKVVLLHDPRHDTKLYHPHVSINQCNVTGGQPMVTLPVSLSELKQSLVNTIRRGNSSWFGCDVDKDSSFEYGVLATEMFDLDSAVNSKLKMSKEDQVVNRESYPTHAMLMVGVNIDPSTNQPNRWRVENSWGYMHTEDPGYLLMTDSWFDQYLYEAVVDREDLAPDLAQKIDQHRLMLVYSHENDPLTGPLQ